MLFTRFLAGGLKSPVIIGALVVILAIGVIVPVLNLAVAPGSALHIPDHMVPLFGKYLCYAIVHAKSNEMIHGFRREFSHFLGVVHALE